MHYVFAYGSLMWNPGFEHAGVWPARIFGYHRKLCVLSTHYRGCEDRPGVVLGLDKGGSCCGLVYAVEPNRWPDVRKYLDDRELITHVYDPKWVKARISDGNMLSALVYVVRVDHHQYCGKATFDQVVDWVAHGCGTKGTSLEYLQSTLAHMDELGISDGPLHRIYKAAINSKR